MPLFSQVRISIVEKDSLRAIASCKVSDVLYITGLRVVHGRNGLFVTMPANKGKDGEYHDIYFPASKEMRAQLQATILEAYHKEKGTTPEAAAPAPVPQTQDSDVPF